ncbi:hypothetical protein E2C01_101337 [Portunus trituberculatus]|uniref:Uncharacterized protein n=1 Tax=Portunus trituberculatus TaxID=210409 RepID=A0A5B7KFC2_PORTR|nr:hypothetical protein [Portunus trituberculatus]
MVLVKSYFYLLPLNVLPATPHQYRYHTFTTWFSLPTHTASQNPRLFLSLQSTNGAVVARRRVLGVAAAQTFNIKPPCAFR